MKNSFFKYKNFNNKLPDFGFKIHISAKIDNYKKIIELLIPFLNNKKVSYKYIYKYTDILFNFSKNEDSAESGKLFTIYPETTENCKALLEDLYNYLPKDYEGIYILSDRPYKNSNIIFYRYGTVNLNYDKTYKGLPTIYGPEGEIWQDYQKTYFDLPSWVEDIQEDMKFESSYLSENYDIKDVLNMLIQGMFTKEKIKIIKI